MTDFLFFDQHSSLSYEVILTLQRPDAFVPFFEAPVETKVSTAVYNPNDYY